MSSTGLPSNPRSMETPCEPESLFSCHPMFLFPSTPAAASPNMFVRSGSPKLSRKPGLASDADENKSFLDSKRDGSDMDSLEVSFELPAGLDNSDCSAKRGNLLGINCGEVDDKCTVCDGIEFQKDNFFQGGDVMSAYEKVGDGNGLALYQTARSGNFSYKFQTLEPGNYFVDLHFAEIIFIRGPPGMRVFDVFIQDEKVVSGLDIYSQIGSNKPLILSDLNATVVGDEGLVIRFGEVNGSPLVCGISIRCHSSAGKGLRIAEGKLNEELVNTKDDCSDCKKLKREYNLLCEAQEEIERALENARKDNELKAKECHEAWMVLQDLQKELMRKSMHVGTLAFAVEGQVKERTRWFSALRELTENVKILKVGHRELHEEASQYRTYIRDMVGSLASVQFAVRDQDLLEKENQDLKQKFIKEAKWRKELYNKVLEMKGSIRVICRCRPLNTEETTKGISTVVDFDSEKEGDLTIKAHGAPRKVFKFDTVFGPDADQESVFMAAAPMATSVLDGYNVCIFAYGQTGTGKTFTMEGTAEARGVNYKTLEELFRIIDERKALFQYEVCVSVLEVYNEQIRDLLMSDAPGGGAARRLEIRQVGDGAHAIPGLVEASVSNMNEVWDVLQTGRNARAVGSTTANEHSSRSHCIHCVMVKGKNLMNAECIRSKLWLVDLAGSERVAKTDVQGERLKEAQNINKSLSALGDVISALATKSPHIPFRNSKLTHLLQDSLGGESKSLMFVQISPSESDLNETICSLNFASRVRGIELGPAKKQVDGGEIFKYKQLLEKAKQDNKGKDIAIKKMEDAIQCMDAKIKAKDTTNKALQDKVKELESQLLEERTLARQHIDTKLAENVRQQQKHTTTVRKLPLTNQRMVDNQNQAEEPTTAFREISNMITPLIENNIIKMGSLPLNAKSSKENRPEVIDEAIPRRLDKFSICNLTPGMSMVPTKLNRLSMYAGQRGPAVPASRCSSLISNQSHCCPSVPTHAHNNNTVDILSASPSTFTNTDKTNETRGIKKHKSILRRSLQKKVLLRPQHQKNVKKDSNLEKMMNGRMRARRVPVNKVVTAPVDRDQQQKRQKERWNDSKTLP